MNYTMQKDSQQAKDEEKRNEKIPEQAVDERKVRHNV